MIFREYGIRENGFGKVFFGQFTFGKMSIRENVLQENGFGKMSVNWMNWRFRKINGGGTMLHEDIWVRNSFVIHIFNVGLVSSVSQSDADGYTGIRLKSRLKNAKITTWPIYNNGIGVQEIRVVFCFVNSSADPKKTWLSPWVPISPLATVRPCSRSVFFLSRKYFLSWIENCIISIKNSIFHGKNI